VSWDRWAITVEYLLAVALFVGFVVTYWVLTRGRWYRTTSGRFIMGFSASLAWLMVLAAVNAIFPDYPLRAVIRVVSFGALDLVGYFQLKLLLQAQRSRRRAKHAAVRMARERERNGYTDPADQR
jgi:hypothetical protein